MGVQMYCHVNKKNFLPLFLKTLKRHMSLAFVTLQRYYNIEKQRFKMCQINQIDVISIITIYVCGFTVHIQYTWV